MSIKQYIPHNIKWLLPLELGAQIDEPYWILLYSGTKTSYSGRYSFLACGLNETIQGNDFSELEAKLSRNNDSFSNAWFGYLGYGLKDSLEKLEVDKPVWLDLPDLMMMKFSNIYQFDHEKQILTLWSDGNKSANIIKQNKKTLPSVTELSSNMSLEEYLEKAKLVIDRIHSGDLYQANLTRKFYGEFETAPDYFHLFEKLCDISPAPYSAFIKMGSSYVISSSPESFASIDANGNIVVRPIKGTAPRGKDQESDEEEIKKLKNSEKDRAENLMIVDLMRNDLSRCCVPGSVKTDSLFDVTTHATIHHLSSTISGKKLPEFSTLDAIKSIFPPGSMTGAPKISAMNLCSQLEQFKRGVYSGAIGWFGGDGSAELSVVIRTIIANGNRFEFQVGGGIVADSTPQKELAELINKAKGIMLALDVPLGKLEEL